MNGESTVRVFGAAYDAVEEIVMGADLSVDLLVFGRTDGTAIFVSGRGDLPVLLAGLELKAVFVSESSVALAMRR